MVQDTRITWYFCLAFFRPKKGHPVNSTCYKRLHIYTQKNVLKFQLLYPPERLCFSIISVRRNASIQNNV